jgi:hypothetical protein
MVESAIPIGAISERDVDLLVLEELNVSSQFAEWLVGLAFPGGATFQELVYARHSVADAVGESDLVFVFLDKSRDRRALLIENKINAPPQPDQAARYRARAESGARDGHWAQSRTCLLAPKQYLQAGEKAAGYDTQVAYEDIADWLEAQAGPDPRYRYRARLFRDAIARARRRGISKEDPQVTAFWRAYWADVSSLYPELALQAPGAKGASSTWITFRPEKLGKVRTIDHKLAAGNVDLSMLTIPVGQLDELRRRFATVLDSDTRVEPTGKSVAVRIKVPVLDPWEEYSTQQADARTGMKTAYRLWSLARALDPDGPAPDGTPSGSSPEFSDRAGP